MIIGDKNKFALEFEFDEFFDNDFIAFGKYRLYINGFCYGEKSPEHSWFYLVVVGFKKLLDDNDKQNSENLFKDYSDLEIANNYWHYHYDNPFPSEEERQKRGNKEFLGVKGDFFVNCFLI